MTTAGLSVFKEMRRDRLGGLPYLAASRACRCESMSRHTTLGLGGKADLYVEIGSTEDLSRLLLFADARRIPAVVLGGGSNVLFSDSGFRGMVLNLRRGFDWISVDDEGLEAGAGASLAKVVRQAWDRGLSGFEFAVGIPGTIGGALVMNAGTRVGWIGDRVESLRVMDSFGRERVLGKKEAGFRYRGSDLRDVTILSARFRLTPEPASRISERMREMKEYRSETQPPKGRSAGCVWKNGEDYSAGLLLDGLGFKGRRIGGAYVPVEHANFIINDGSATAGDYAGLMREMAGRAKEEKGIDLEPEVVCVGSGVWDRGSD